MAKVDACLMCNYEFDEVKGTHQPEICDPASGVYVCLDCVIRCKTVTNFGLTVEELKKAAEMYQNALAGGSLDW